MSSTVDTLRELLNSEIGRNGQTPGGVAALTDAISKLERAAQLEAALRVIAQGGAKYSAVEMARIAADALLQPNPCPDCAKGGSDG